MARPTIYDRPLTRAERQRRYRQRRKTRPYAKPPVVDIGTVTGRITDLHAAAQHGHRFGTIYADPPWAYDNRSARGAHAPHYAAMSVEDIAALPVAALARDCAHLHLWTTSSFIEEALWVMRQWGFQYRSQFVWAKPTIGTGNYWRLSHELLLTGVRSRSTSFEDRALPSWDNFRRGNHSAKPEEVRTMIERASPPPRLELFARRVATGWCAWGDELDPDGRSPSCRTGEMDLP